MVAFVLSFHEFLLLYIGGSEKRVPIKCFNKTLAQSLKNNYELVLQF